jgi:hypothetical protein
MLGEMTLTRKTACTQQTRLDRSVVKERYVKD